MDPECFDPPTSKRTLCFAGGGIVSVGCEQPYPPITCGTNRALSRVTGPFVHFIPFNLDAARPSNGRRPAAVFPERLGMAGDSRLPPETVRPLSLSGGHLQLILLRLLFLLREPIVAQSFSSRVLRSIILLKALGVGLPRWLMDRPCDNLPLMRTDILGLQAFVSIAERGSFHAAAAHLNLSQTALSHRIRKLEESLATQLLLRTTRQVALTPAGSELLPKARKIFEDLGTAMGDLRATVTARQERIVFGCLPTVAVHVIPGVLSAFARDWPEIAVHVFDSSATEIAERVQSGDAMFGITIMAADRWNLEMKPLAREPFVLVCHKDMAIASERVLNWSQLNDVPLVRISAETGNRILIDDALGARSETLPWRYEVQRITTAIGLARSGVVAVIVPQLAFHATEMKSLVSIPLRAPAITRTLGVITRKDTILSAPAQTFLDLIKASLAKHIDTQVNPTHI